MPPEASALRWPALTLASQTIHTPGEPPHVTRLRSLAKPVRVFLGDPVLAVSRVTVRLIEVARALCDPLFYVPQNDVVVDVMHTDTRSLCLLRGETRCFRLKDALL